MKKSMVFFCCAFIAMLGLDGFANTLTVTSLVDEFPTANNVLDTSALTQGTFRWALANSSEGDTIVFDDSIAGGTINMLSVKDVTPQQDTSFVIAHALTIEGNGVTINGGWNGTPGNASGTRIFLTVADQGKTTIKNLNLINGHATVWYSTEEKYFLGGAICANSPIRLEGCRLENNCSMDKSDFYDYPEIRGGGAIFATANVEIDSCYFGTNSVHASSARGGAICQAAGSLTVEDTVFDHNYSKIWGGGAVYLHGPVTKATFTNCKLIENSSSNVDRPGGAILSLMTGGEMKFFGCAFRGNNVPSGGRGGAICMYDAYGLSSTTAVTAVDCEFSDGCAGWGGALFLAVSSSPLFVNCTFHGNSTATYSAVLQITSAKPYFVNCTVAGSYDRGDGSDCGPLYASDAKLLNTVFAYNYKGVSSATLSDKRSAGFTRTCSIYDGYSSLSGSPVPYTLATSMDDLEGAIKLFADYEMVSEGHGYLPDTRETQPTALMPKLGGDEYGTRVVEIDPDGVLASGGYPVRVNADYSYVEYSDDGGKTWKQFFSRDGASKENLTQITADQRGVPYADGAVPIGAATFGNGCGHEHTTTNGYVAATCEGVGDTGLVTCDECGATLFDHEEIPALGHAWDEGSITTPPTCTEKGVKTYTCTRTGCGGTKTENIDELGHKWGEWVVTKEPSKTETGLRERDCQHGGCSAHQEEAIPMIVDVAALRNIAVVTTIGTEPTLPAKVAGLKADGTVGGEYDVVWSGVTAPSAAGITTVTGTAQVNGAPMSVTAVVRAAAAPGDSVNIAPLASSMTVEVSQNDWKECDQQGPEVITNGYGNVEMKINDWNSPGGGNYRNIWKAAHPGENTVTVSFAWDSSKLISKVFLAIYDGNGHGEYILKNGSTHEVIPSSSYTCTRNGSDYYKINQGEGVLIEFSEPMSLSELEVVVEAGSTWVAFYEIEIWAEAGAGSVDPLTTDTLSALAVDGNAVAGFAPTTYDYTVEKGTEITSATSTDNVGITILQKSVTASDNAYVVTLAEDGESTQKYTVAMPDVWESGTIIYLQ